MLPLPNLDDRMFEDILQEARKMIPKLLPQWTNENPHDPGITLLELMTWLSETQQYYLNRITQQSERKFLKLLGVRQLEAVSALCDVSFAGMKRPLVLPKGTPLLAIDQEFETVEMLKLIPCRLDKVVVRTGVGAGDFTSNNRAAIAYYAFGAEARRGSKLYIGFDSALPINTDVAMSIKLFDDYPVPVGQGDGADSVLISTANVSWTYAGDGQDESWLPVKLLRDTTVHLSQSGEVVLRIDEEMKASRVYPADDAGRYWLCCTLEEEGYELPPKVEKISLNSVKAVQSKTYSEIHTFDSSGKAHAAYEAATHLALSGTWLVQIYEKSQVEGEEAGVWRDWQETADLSLSTPDAASYTVERDEEKGLSVIRFGDGIHGAVPPAGKGRIRCIAYVPEFEYTRWIGQSNGLPDQQFEAAPSLNAIAHTMLLQVGWRSSTKQPWVWEDWQRVDDFDNSGSDDRHYTFDSDTGIITFGNNEEGWIPPVSEEGPNVRFVSLQTGGGIRGNVHSGTVSALLIDDYAKWSDVTVTNPFPAYGGTQRETLASAKLRVQNELNTPFRAVTNADYELLAGQTPGVRVARVKAIPLYAPGMRDYPRVKAPAHMTVVVVPYSEAGKPKAGKGFLETVKKHLDAYRLLTTEVHVIPAEYIKITVHAVVVVQQQYKEEAARIERELRQLLQPMGFEDGLQGWTFGRPVYKGDIYGVISRLKGVAYVQDLWMDAEGQGAVRDAGGDIHLPPYGLVYSGDHEIELISQSDI